MSFTSKSNETQQLSLEQLINAFAQGEFASRGSIRMKAKEERGDGNSGNGRSPINPRSPAKAEISENFWKVVKASENSKIV